MGRGYFPLLGAGLVALALLGAASSARAQDVVLMFSRDVSLTGGTAAGTAYRGQIAVDGLDVATGEITSVRAQFPDGRVVPLQSEAGRFTLDLAFTSRAELDTGFPDGSYTVTLVTPDEEREVAVTYAGLAIASPVIRTPDHQSINNQPALTRFEFAACGSGCSGSTSTASLAFAADSGVPIESQTFDSQTTEFVPSVPLQESTAYGFSVVHVGFTTKILDPNDPVLFVNRVDQSDQVEFSTTGPPPVSGALCFVVNDPTGLLHDPNGSCIKFEDPEGAVYDPSGTVVATSVGDLDVEYDFELNRKGKVSSGIALVDADGDGTLETSVPVQGRITGRRGRLRQRIRFRVRDAVASPDADLKVTVSERIETTAPDALQRTVEERLRGKRAGSKVEETQVFAESAVEVPLGWRIDFTIDRIADDGRTIEVSGARLRMGVDGPAGVRDIELKGKGRFSPVPDRSKLNFKSFGVDRGIRVRLHELRMEGSDVQTVQINIIAIGQRARVKLF
jgi:hypothetical protein